MIPINIEIDLSGWEEYLTATEERLQTYAGEVLDALANEFVEKLTRLSSIELGQTRDAYQKAIYRESQTSLDRVIGLRGWLPNAVEQGIGAFDVKEGGRRSSKVKRSARGGWYLIIPFRHGVPGTLATNAMFSSIMPKEVHNIARTLARGEQLRVAQLPAKYQIPKVRREVTNPTTGRTFPEYKNQSPVYANMNRSSEQYHSHYTTFRTMGGQSDPNSWIHTGIRKHDLFMKTITSMDINSVVGRVKF